MKKTNKDKIFFYLKVIGVIVYFMLVHYVLGLWGAEAYHSVSLRQPKEDVEPVDFELKLGYSDKLVLKGIHLLYERENDNIYRGLDLQTHETKSENLLLDGYSGEIFISEAIGINEQWIYRRFARALGTDLRVSVRGDTWEYDGVFLGMKTGYEFYFWKIGTYYETSFDTDFLGTNIWRNNAVLKIGNQSLKFVRNIGGGNDYWQIKQEGNYKW